MAQHIVILGAGYAGLTAARRLARGLRQRDARLTVIARSPVFVERVRLHQWAAGQTRPEYRLDRILMRKAAVLVASVTAIDLQGRRLTLDDRTTIDYDTLVYALGSTGMTGVVPGAAENALGVARRDTAARIAEQLRELSAGASIAVVGGGLTGIEVAAELAESRPDLRVALHSAGRIGEWLSAPAQRHITRVFDRLRILRQEMVRIREVLPDAIRTDAGVRFVDLVVWTAGFSVPTIARESGLAVDGAGRILVDDRLRSVSHPEVYAIGDAAAAPVRRGITRMSCQMAVPMGAAVARQVLRVLDGRLSRPVRLRYVFQNISLGRRDGIVQFTGADDRVLSIVLVGRLAAGFKELIVWGAAARARGWLPRR